MEHLFKHCANLNLANKQGDTALIWAADKGHKEVVKFLILHGADLHAVNQMGRSALFWAEQNGHEEVVRIIRDAQKTLFLIA